MPQHRMGWRADKPDFRDKTLTLPYLSRFKVVLPSSVDLRPDMPPVVDQGDLGSCTANAIAGAVEYMHKKSALPVFPPSRLFIYYNERFMENTVAVDAGAEIRDGIKSIKKIGVCDESIWPYDISKFTQRPTDQAYGMAKSAEITTYLKVTQNLTYLMATLAKGYAIVFGITVYQSIDKAEKTGIVPMPAQSEATLGGHAILMVGYDTSAKTFTFRNSWGADWGNKGYGTLPFDYVLHPGLASDFWCIPTIPPATVPTS
jgi:C1A family cysteine protease